MGGTPLFAVIYPQRIVWHHSGDISVAPQLHKIDRYHKSREFPISSLGWYVGYHYLIENDGTVHQTRKEDELGAHDAGENSNSIGICLAGDFSLRLPTEEQRVSVARLIADIRTRYPIPVTRIEPHRWDDKTECPGSLLSDNWLIEQYLSREASLFHRLFWYLGVRYQLL